MKSFLALRIAELLAEHDVDLLTDGKGRIVAIQHTIMSGPVTTKHRDEFAAACYFAPLLLDERLTRIVAS